MTGAPNSQRQGPDSQRTVAAVTLALICVCAIIELALPLSDLELIEAWRLRRRAIEYAGFWPGLLQDWRPNYQLQPYVMFASYGFLHAGPMHFLVNMLVLWSLGRAMADYANAKVYALVFFASLLGGAFAFGLLAPSLRPMVGASGALFGLFGAIMVWTFRTRRREGHSLRGYWWFLAAILAVNIALWWAMRGQLAWETHLGGLLTGALIAVLVRPSQF